MAVVPFFMFLVYHARQIRARKKSTRRLVGAFLHILGYKDSNLGMNGSEPFALPLGDTPITQLLYAKGEECARALGPFFAPRLRDRPLRVVPRHAHSRANHQAHSHPRPQRQSIHSKAQAKIEHLREINVPGAST